MSNMIDSEARQDELLDELYETVSCLVIKYKAMMNYLVMDSLTPKEVLDQIQEIKLNEGADLDYVVQELGNYT
jgi:hypothetical protein